VYSVDNLQETKIIENRIYLISSL